jgi:hypothetical protein
MALKGLDDNGFGFDFTLAPAWGGSHEYVRPTLRATLEL